MNADAKKLFDECLEMTAWDRAAAAQLLLADALKGNPTRLLERPLTVPETASYLRVRKDKILHWIHSGELPAYNVAANQGGQRPKYRIDPEAIRTFATRRAATPPTPRGRPVGACRRPLKIERPRLETARPECGRSRPADDHR